jgi:hypothetical protein
MPRGGGGIVFTHSLYPKMALFILKDILKGS